LFDRSGRTVTLTQAGAAALEHARTVLDSARAVRQAVDDVNRLVRGRLTIGMVNSCTIKPLFDALESFHVRHPAVEIILFEADTEHLVTAVRSGSADLALIAMAGEVDTEEPAMRIAGERLVAAVLHGHPLAEQDRVTLSDVISHPIVCLPRGTGIRTVFDDACHAKGVRPQIAMQAGAPPAVADLAARGLGVAVLTASLVEAHRDKLKVLPLEDVETPAVLALRWSCTVGPALRELLAHCRRAFGVSADGKDDRPAALVQGGGS